MLGGGRLPSVNDRAKILAEGTKTREGAVMNGAVRIKPFNPSSIPVLLLPIRLGVGMEHLAFPFVSKSIQRDYSD